MKVIVASTDVPFVGGGGTTAIVDWLSLELTAAGHEVDTLRFPFVSETTAMLDQILALRLLDLGETADLISPAASAQGVVVHPSSSADLRPVADLAA